MKFKLWGATVMALLCFSNVVTAQWVTQEIKLVPGFNPVYLPVTPPNADCQAVFGNVPGIKDVWMYNRYLQTSTFTSNPQEANRPQDHWLMWFPASSAKSFLSTLAQVRAGQCYLINLAADAAPVTLRITGIPAPPRVDWIPNDLVLAGFPIQETGKVTFYQHLKDTPEVSTTPGSLSGIYSINPLSARESQIRNPEITAITPGKAYWVRLSAHSVNPYPFKIVAPGENNSIQFVQDQKVTTLTLVNSIEASSVPPQKLKLRLVDSAAPPPGKPHYAGRAEIAALLPAADGSYVAKLLSEPLEVTLVSGQTLQLQIGLATALLSPNADTNGTYQALLEVTEATHGFRQVIPVVAEVPGSKLFAVNGSLMGNPGRGKLRAASASTGVTANSPSAGLWLGTVTLNEVNQPGFSEVNNPSAADYPVTPSTPLSLRALIHVNADGVASLVHQVYFAEVSDGTNRAVQMFNSPSSFPAGSVPKARLSAASWPRLPPTAMTGAFGKTLQATLTLAYDDPLNPFLHRYHPDHNNLAEDFQTKLAPGKESFDIGRNPSFYFGATTTSGSAHSPAVPVFNFTGKAGEFISTSGFTTNAGISAQFWLKTSTFQQNGATLLLLTNNSSKTTFHISFENNTGGLGLTVQNAAGETSRILSKSPVPLGAWFNVTTTFDGTAGKIYFNGEKTASGSMVVLESGAWTSAWIGNSSSSGSASFTGQIHDMTVRNSALDPAIVPELMVVPDMINPADILLRLQGDATTLSIANLGAAQLTVDSSLGLVDATAAPSVPQWTFGTAQGTYRETITGLRRQAITLGGSFKFTRINQDPNLR